MNAAGERLFIAHRKRARSPAFCADVRRYAVLERWSPREIAFKRGVSDRRQDGQLLANIVPRAAGLQVRLELDEHTCKTLKGIADVGRLRVTQDRNGKVASAARALEWANELCERGLLRIRLVIDPGLHPLAFGAVEFVLTPTGDGIGAAWSCEAALAEQSPAGETGGIAAE